MDVQHLGSRIAALVGRESFIVRALRPVYEHLLLALSGGRGIRWTINGEEYRIDPRRRRQLGHDYDAPVAAYLKSSVRPGDLCYDVGANVGVYILQLARWAGPAGRVVAFEPNPHARQVLDRHIRWNALTSRVRVVPAAVSDSPGHAELYAAGADGMARLGVENQYLANLARPVEVNVTSLDHFVGEGPRPKWIIIDVEGYELAVLRGARRVLTGADARPRVVVEMHPNVWPSLGESRDSAERLLRELGLTAIPLTGQSDALAEHGNVALEPVSG
jgi:FkbM family methyltransferase